MANSHRKCKYKECDKFYRVADGLKDFCSEPCKVLQFKARPVSSAKNLTKVKAKPVKKKLKSLPKLIEECAVTLQRLVRVKAAVAANKNGMIQCVTCEKWLHFNEAQGGHMIERGKASVKLVEKQVNPQCSYCNHWGMKLASCVLRYRNFLVDRHGEQWMHELETQARQTKKYTRSEVETIHNDYKARLDALEREL